MSVTFTELLPATKSSRHNGINWTPTDGPSTGILTVHTGRSTTIYKASEFQTEWDGRAFNLVKLTPGTDKEETVYNVFCHRGQQDNRCECKGFEFTGHCKHIAAVNALLENEMLWSRSELINREQDVTSTECPF